MDDLSSSPKDFNRHTLSGSNGGDFAIKVKLKDFSLRVLALDLIHEERQPLDYAKIVTPELRVLAIAETHSSAAHKKEFITQMQQFKALHFTYLAMEFWGSDIQPVLDEFQEHGTGKEKLKKYAEEILQVFYDGVGDFYISAVEEATKAGIKVIGMDVSQEEKKLHKEEKEYKRDKSMAKTVQEILDADEKNRVVIYAGGFHANKIATAMAGILVKEGYNLININFFGEGENTLERAVSEVGVGSERFMLGYKPKYAKLFSKFDWNVYIPKEEKTPMRRYIDRMKDFMK